MQVSTHLRKDKIDKDGLAPIRMLISGDGVKIFKVIPGIKCKLNNWDETKGRIKPFKKNEEYNYYIEYNKIIDERESKVKNIFRYLLLNNIKITAHIIKEKLDVNENISLSLNFLQGFEEFILKNKNTKTARTIKGYRTVFNYLLEYQNQRKIILQYDSINLDFFEKLRDYCFGEKTTSSNYFAKIISVIKTYMNWAFDKEYHNNINFKKFKATENEIEVIYLTMDELMKLYNFEFDTIRLNHVKDTYCFGCLTGLRFSDIEQLRASNIFDDHIKINIQKTKTIDHKVPLNQYSKNILEKYKNTINEPLPVISNQKFNKYLKECCKIVEIDKPTTITRYYGQKRIDKTLPKYQLISSHTARKTFVTNSLVLGMNQMVVRNITGHKNETSFRRYVKIADDFKKQEMDNTWNKISLKE